MNVVFDDNIGFYQSRVTQRIECDAPSSSLPNEANIKDNSEDDDEESGVTINLDQGRVHKNHSPADVIGGVFDERVTRKKQINFKEMV